MENDGGSNDPADAGTGSDASGRNWSHETPGETRRQPAELPVLAMIFGSCGGPAGLQAVTAAQFEAALAEVVRAELAVRTVKRLEGKTK